LEPAPQQRKVNQMINLADELDDEFLEDLEETNKNFRLIQ